MLARIVIRIYGCPILTIRKSSNITYDLLPTVTCSKKNQYESRIRSCNEFHGGYIVNHQYYIQFDYWDHTMGRLKITVTPFKSVTIIGLFTPITNVNCIELFNWDVSQVKGVETWFNNCKFFNITLTGWKFGPITNIKQMFQESKRLVTINIQHCDAPNITNMDKLFYSCHNLYSVNLTNCNIPNLISMRGMFSHCIQLENIIVDNEAIHNVVDMTNCFKDCRSLNKLDNDWKLTRLQFIDGIFYGCTKLWTIDLSSWDLSNVKSFDHCFKNCGVYHIGLNPNVNSYVTSAIECFEGCQHVDMLDLSMWDVSNMVDMSGCFKDCCGLTELNISTWEFDVNRDINVEESFLYCDKLKCIYCRPDVFLYFLLNGAFGESYTVQWGYDTSIGAAYKLPD